MPEPAERPYENLEEKEPEIVAEEEKLEPMGLECATEKNIEGRNED